MKRHRITRVRKANDEYAVTTIDTSGPGPLAYQRRPCGGCPWRTDVPTGVFPAEAFRLSAHTAYDLADASFACHEMGAENSGLCAGFLLRGADDNLDIRWARMKGEYDPTLVTDGGAPLYDSYRAMAEANGVPADDPILEPCRPESDGCVSYRYRDGEAL